MKIYFAYSFGCCGKNMHIHMLCELLLLYLKNFKRVKNTLEFWRIKILSYWRKRTDIWDTCNTYGAAYSISSRCLIAVLLLRKLVQAISCDLLFEMLEVTGIIMNTELIIDYKQLILFHALKYHDLSYTINL